jgi:hypothetical protein
LAAKLGEVAQERLGLPLLVLAALLVADHLVHVALDQVAHRVAVGRRLGQLASFAAAHACASRIVRKVLDFAAPGHRPAPGSRPCTADRRHALPRA